MQELTAAVTTVMVKKVASFQFSGNLISHYIFNYKKGEKSTNANMSNKAK